MVGIGELVFSTDPAEVVEMIGLGSCVGVFLAVPGRFVGAAHVLLPASNGQVVPIPGKFADTAIPALLKGLDEVGIARSRVTASLAGGNQVLQFAGGRPEFEIGRRNIEAVTGLLEAARIRIGENRTGGTSASTVRVPVATGRFADKLAA